jgi:hypothetical protein
MPKTYPVNGKVVWQGGRPVTDGRIEFQSQSDSSLKAVGGIERDGSFVLTTYKEGKQRNGAVEGQHRVLVEPEWGGTSVLITLPNPYTVEPHENTFTIEVRPPRR